MKYDLKLQPIEKEVAFLKGLCPKWKSTILMVKTHEYSKSYKLSQVIGIIKSLKVRS